MRLICKDIDEFFLNLKLIRKHAAETDIEFRTRTCSYKNRSARKNEKFTIGDWVWLHTEVNIDQHKVQTKLDVNWVGPYLVLEAIPPSSYKLQHKMKVAHVITDNIFKLYQRSTPSNKLSPIAGQVRKEIKELNRFDVMVTANLDLDLL